MNRRSLVLALASALLSISAVPAAEPGPADVVTAIYRRAASGKGDGGGQFLWLRSRDRRANFTRHMADLWDRAEAATPEGDQAPPGFDPVTVSQDPNLGSFRVTMDDDGAERARVAVAVIGHGSRMPYATAHYLLVREGSRWLIDDITGAIDGKPWSIRALLASHLASYGKASADMAIPSASARGQAAPASGNALSNRP